MSDAQRDRQLDRLEARLVETERRLASAERTITALTAKVRTHSHSSLLRRLAGKVRRIPASIRRRRRMRAMRLRVEAERPVVSAAEAERRSRVIESFLDATEGTAADDDGPPLTMEPAAAEVSTDAPLVSVIIPVHNAIGDLMACLRSFDRHPPGVTYEIIVANDCSDEEQFAPVRQLAGVRVVDTDTNLGFLLNCNAAAAHARGEYLWFLNSDTELLDRSLDALVATFDDFPDAVIAGSKLVYPDGVLQEAGGIVWRDASAWNLGKYGDATDPTLDYARVADYVSGASILVTRSFWDEAGGFDTAFVPAYYEDTDLCMQAAVAGHDVVYQSGSVVVHHEGSSHGNDVDDESSMKHHQLKNHEVFLHKWSTELASHRENGVEPEREKERRVERRLLLIDARTLTPDQDSGSLRMLNLIRAQRALGFKVTFLPKNLQADEPYAERLRCMGVEVVAAPHVVGVDEFLAERGAEFDVVMLSRLEVAELYLGAVREHCSQAQVVYDTVDLHFLRQSRELRLTGDISGGFDLERTLEMELACAERADTTIVCSTSERELMADLVPGARVEVVGNIHEPEPPGPPPGTRRDLLFVGGFEHPPNIDAVQWFVADIMPLVNAALPDAVVHVVGSKMPDEMWSLAGPTVEIHGYVPDLDSLYDRTRVCIAPLRFGAGVKGKVTEALAKGVPCVGTSMAVEGAGMSHGVDVLIADTPERFADACIAVLTDDEQWERLADGGRALLAERFSLAAATEQLARLVEPVAR